MLTKAFEAILILTPWVTVLAGLLLVVRRWLLPRQPAAQALRLAWLALAVRCALPVRLALPTPAPAVSPAWGAPVLVRPEGVPGVSLQLAATAAASPSPAAGPSLEERLMILWALGVLGFVAVQLARHLVFCWHLRKARQRLPLPGRVYRSAGAQTPVTVGWLRPAVYLPVSLAPDDLPFVLAHERRHIRAGDLWFQLVLLVAQSLYWFDPLIHRMAMAARQDMEMACDAAVLRGKPLAYRLRYGDTVLTALKTARRQAALAAPLCGPGRAAQIRFKEMLNMRTPKKSLLVLPALLCAAVLACSLFTACAEQPESSSPAGSDPAAFSTENGASSPESASAPETLSIPEPQSDPATFSPSDATGEDPAEGTSTGFAWPVPDAESINRLYRDTHAGVDMIGEYGTPVYAIQDGTVLAAGPRDDDPVDSSRDWYYGIRVRLDHGNGLQSLYAHLSGVAVEKGDTVEEGQLIGYMGSTGRSTGTHLHLEAWQDGSRFDPLTLFGAEEIPEIENGQNLTEEAAANTADSSANSGAAG